MEPLTKQEEEAMLHIWSLKECIVKDVLGCYEDPKPPYTTLASIVKNLHRKGYVSSRRIGTTYLYAPKITAADYQRVNMKHVVSNYFKNSYKEMVSFFAKEEKLNSKDLQEIIDLIEEKHSNKK